MSLYSFPTMAEQASPTWLGGGAAKAMAGTAAFLKEQGRVQEVKPDYSAFVTDDLRRQRRWASSAQGATRDAHARHPRPHGQLRRQGRHAAGAGAGRT